MENTHNQLAVALDIGTTKICAIAGRKNEHGKLEILGVGRIESLGVLRGVVSNIERTVTAISEAVAMAERASKMKFATVHVGISGQHINSIVHRNMLTRDNDHTEIGQTDIDRLISELHRVVLPAGEKIIDIIPQEYTVDSEQGIIDPIGMSGIRLEGKFHVVTGQSTASNNIKRCIEKAGLRMAGITLQGIASAHAVLSDEEKEAGVCLVDMGGGTTDVIIYHDGIIRHTAVIPFGGMVITSDIKEGCTVMQQQAEQLKVKFGSALADEVYENRIITIPGLKGRDHKEISEKNLARIIQARIEEILDYILIEIRNSGYERKLIGGIVLTGGGAMLRHLEQLCEFHTGLNTRIGMPIEHLAHGYGEQVSGPNYATAIGLLLKAINERSFQPPMQEVKPEPKPAAAEPTTTATKEDTPSAPNSNPAEGPWYNNLWQRTKEWFEAEPDTDL